MLSVYEFRNVGSIGTGTTMIGTGTNPFLSMGNGIGTTLLLSHGYRYHLCLVPVPNCDSVQKWQILSSFTHFSSINLSIPSYIKKPHHGI